MTEPSEKSPAASTPVATGMSGEWEQRSLCPDESCLGVLGADGRCRLCGLRGDLSQPQGPAAPAAEDVPPPDEAAAEPAPSGLPSTQPSACSSNEGEDFDGRQLCPSDDCIGVLGSDGACKVCGRQKDLAGSPM